VRGVIVETKNVEALTTWTVEDILPDGIPLADAVRKKFPGDLSHILKIW
jgi:hypothetical protein